MKSYYIVQEIRNNETGYRAYEMDIFTRLSIFTIFSWVTGTWGDTADESERKLRREVSPTQYKVIRVVHA